MSAPVIAAGASDAPQRQIGTRTRSGNAMLRTRGNLLEATAHCVERYGVRRTTMGDIALKAVVAKATLYNHFRTKHYLLDAQGTVTSRGIQPGEMAPDFELPQAGGGSIRLSDLRGRPVLLHFGSYS